MKKKISACWDDTDPANEGWHATLLERDETGEWSVVDSSENINFPANLDCYRRGEIGEVRRTLRRRFPGAEIEVS